MKKKNWEKRQDIKKSGEISEEHFIHRKVCEKKISQKDTEKSAQIKKSHSVRKTYFKKIDETTVIITKDYSKN